MDLLEYQAKTLFQETGIPVLQSQRIEHSKDLKGLKIPYPVVLKSQVYTGGRGKAGGIRFVETTIDAIAAAQAIFSLPIMGQYPAVLLAEAKYDPEQEFYLAVVLDRSLRCPLLLGSQQGGVGIESAMDQMQQVIVDQEFSPFYARRLAFKMGLRGDLLCSVSLIIEKMYQLFVQKDLDLVEINPLAIGPNGEVMALDGKITVNDDALGRHPDLLALREHIPHRTEARERIAGSAGLHWVEMGGNVGLLCNGAGLMMATLDLVHRAGGKPASCVNLGGECAYDWPPNTLQGRLEQALKLLIEDKSNKVVLVNLLGSTVSWEAVAGAITNGIEQAETERKPRFIVRCVGELLDHAKDLLSAADVALVEHLDAAVEQAVKLAR